ncbi:MAG: PQQ-binding-like beta-propeller repeat protein [Gemmatimonadota bacterium]
MLAINPDGSLAWRFATGDYVTSSPAIGSDGTIYVGSDDDVVYAVHPDGSLAWRYKTVYYVTSSPTLGPGGTVYVGSWDHNLYALASASAGPATSAWGEFHHDPSNSGRAH